MVALTITSEDDEEEEVEDEEAEDEERLAGCFRFGAGLGWTY